VLRQMTLNIEPKWQETILGIARDEHGKEFAVRGMQEETAVTTDPSAIGMEMGIGLEEGQGHGGPRRGGRRPESPEKHE
jgi:small subunit ribosomal protein S6